jgi:hypothetical protein
MSTTSKRVTFTYTNYRGEVSVRLVLPPDTGGFFCGSTEWHPEPQWLLRALDLHKGLERTFAVKDIKDWAPAS